jgi:hypothetical protein
LKLSISINCSRLWLEIIVKKIKRMEDKKKLAIKGLYCLNFS